MQPISSVNWFQKLPSSAYSILSWWSDFFKVHSHDLRVPVACLSQGPSLTSAQPLVTSTAQWNATSSATGTGRVRLTDRMLLWKAMLRELWRPHQLMSLLCRQVLLLQTISLYQQLQLPLSWHPRITFPLTKITLRWWVSFWRFSWRASWGECPSMQRYWH